MDSAKGEKMSDNISRQAALAYPLSWEHYDKEHGDRKFICGVESYREYIEHLPSVDEWTPCSERLPDIDEKVLVCWSDGSISDGYRWNEEDWFCAWGEYNGWHDDKRSVYIVAWMPLPEPYKGGEL